jgi:hypothetical protein
MLETNKIQKNYDPPQRQISAKRKASTAMLAWPKPAAATAFASMLQDQMALVVRAERPDLLTHVC